MSVVVWDGKTLAADRQGSQSDMRVLVSKIKRLPDGTLLAWTGAHENGLAMARWYEDGAIIAKLPPSQNKDDWSRLIVLEPDLRLITFEQYGEPLEILDCPIAFGAGRDFALGAMAMGADARKAVEVACQFSIVCGLGVEAIDIVSRQRITGKSPSRIAAVKSRKSIR